MLTGLAGEIEASWLRWHFEVTNFHKTHQVQRPVRLGPCAEGLIVWGVERLRMELVPPEWVGCQSPQGGAACKWQRSDGLGPQRTGCMEDITLPSIKSLFVLEQNLSA